MSNYLHQTGKETLNQPVFIGDESQKFANSKISDNLGNKQTLTTAQPVGTTHIGSGMPEAYMSAAGGYYAANNTGFAAMSFPNFNQPAQWSTGTNNPPAAPQNYDHTAMQYSTLGAAPNAPANADAAQNHQQYVTADHLFNQNNSNYQSAFSAAPFMNGSWSYFNNPSSYFFPGNGDLNLNWGTAAAPTDNPNNALFQDLYKPPPPPTELEKQSKGDVIPTSELSSGFENGEVKPPAVETVEQSLSGMSVNEKEVEKNLDNSVPPTNLSNNTVSAPIKPIAPVSTPSGHSNAPAKPVSWAAVASQPAKSKPPPKKPPQKAPTTVPNTKPSYSTQNGTASTNAKGKQQPPTGGRWNRQNQNGNQNSNNTGVDNTVAVLNDSHLDINRMKDNSPLLKKLMHKFNFNPRELNIDMKNARFFIIKSYSEDDIFRSIKYSSWTSTEHGNRRLNDAFAEQQRTGVKTPIYLLFSVNSSGHFCGVAEMMSKVDFDVETGIFVQDKWKGRFDVRWIYVKDVPNNTLRHIRLENNENKPVTNSRDTQEVHPDKAKQVLKIIHNYKAQTSIFDDFSHYEKRQEDDAKLRSKKMPEPNL